MKTQTKAKAPKSGKIADYLTNGKIYDILNPNAPKTDFGWGFSIIDDNGYVIYCCEIESAHLNDLNWKLS